MMFIPSLLLNQGTLAAGWWSSEEGTIQMEATGITGTVENSQLHLFYVVTKFSNHFRKMVSSTF
jgi:hypothetical protein